MRPREVSNAVDLLRLLLTYCLGDCGLRLTATWAAAIGLADLSNVAVLYRLRQSGAWLTHLVGQALAAGLPKAGQGRLIRLIDATTVRKPEHAAAEARRKARKQARKEGYRLSDNALAAADWVILVTSLDPQDFSTSDVLDLYRLRWRIELGFKRLKSIVGLKPPPGKDPRSARAYVLAHLIMILLLEPLVDALEDSPPVQSAA